MFSTSQKQLIARKVEELLLSFNHPEMPTERPNFSLHVAGTSDMSWANIAPNWTYDADNPPSVNPFNEMMGE